YLFFIVLSFHVFRCAWEDAPADPLGRCSTDRRSYGADPRRAVGGERPLRTRFSPRLPPLGLWSSHAERVSTVSVGAAHLYHGSGRPWVRGQHASGSRRSRARASRPLTPPAHGPARMATLGRYCSCRETAPVGLPVYRVASPGARRTRIAQARRS